MRILVGNLAERGVSVGVGAILRAWSLYFLVYAVAPPRDHRDPASHPLETAFNLAKEIVKEKLSCKKCDALRNLVHTDSDNAVIF